MFPDFWVTFCGVRVLHPSYRNPVVGENVFPFVCCTLHDFCFAFWNFSLSLLFTAFLLFCFVHISWKFLDFSTKILFSVCLYLLTYRVYYWLKLNHVKSNEMIIFVLLLKPFSTSYYFSHYLKLARALKTDNCSEVKLVNIPYTHCSKQNSTYLEGEATTEIHK